MLTNKLNLPEPFLRAAEAGLYSKGEARYSVTELIDTPRVGALRRLYRDVIVEDVADQSDSLMGTMFHKLLEAAGAPATEAILEERLYAEVDGTLISGAMDHTTLHGSGCLDDYKSTKVYSVRTALRVGKPDWIAQLNIYRWLRALHGQVIEKLRIIAWMKDWSLRDAMAAAARQPGPGDYPEHAILPIEIPVWTLEETEAYVRERIKLHIAADEWAVAIEGDPALDNEPLCTDDERWREPVRWAVMKDGRKTAIKLYDTKAEAEFVATQTKGGFIEERGGTYKRCVLYCTIGRAGLCTQWERDRSTLPDKGQGVDTSAFD